MQIKIAKSAGFCFGVDRAVNLVFAQLEKGDKVATLGPIIHNPQIVAELSRRGVRILHEPQEAQPDEVVVIRSHGVGLQVYRELEQRGIAYVDATCPFVAKIHRIVSEHSLKGEIVLIAGDEKHPEVAGIIGHCAGKYLVFDTLEGLKTILQTKISTESRCILVGQTTFHRQLFEECAIYAKKVCTNLAIFDTICSATAMRQNEAACLAQESDLMIVIGGRESSNTAKLCSICSAYCPTVHIEGADELDAKILRGVKRVGVTAGASTPAGIIKEVRVNMSEIEKNNEEMSFEELLNQSFKSTYTGERVKATVVAVAPNEIVVDIGTKHAGYVPASEFTDDPSVNINDIVKVGDELELIVVRVNDTEGTVMLSKKRLDAMKGFEKLIAAEESGEILEGTVVEVVKGGVLALTNGVRVFIPASQATASRNDPLEALLKQKVSFKILEVNRQRRRAVGSIRAVLKEQRKALEEQFWNEVEVGKKYTGTVKSLTSYGAFVDLGGVDGMIHISELSWSRIKHPSEVVKVGDTVEVYVRDIDRENKKISLGYKKTEDNPWIILEKNYEVGQVVDAKIVSLTPFGAFAQVIPGIDGLIHISQIANERIEKPQDVLSVGQEVKVKIIEIDFEHKRVSLSMKALLEDQEAPVEE